jgi:insulysin
MRKVNIYLYIDMIKPLIDDRKYRVVKLTNNLDALLISDSTTSRCSASVSVGVGSFMDENISGLAHFAEHMIFLGSKSYPRPGEFEDHLSNYFGVTNAFTEDEKTTFYYDIGCRGFHKSLIMFSRMFAEPLFDINYMNKEIEAVNSENEKNLNQDNWREHQLLKHLSEPGHTYNRFNTGNNVTLRAQGLDILQDRLRNYYKKHYTPQNMKLVILSNTNIETLQNMATQFFSDIRLDSLKSKPLMYNDIRMNTKAYNSELLGKITWFEKIAATNSLDLVFMLDEVVSELQSKPLDYISYLLKYRKKGALFNHLKIKKYATQMDVSMLASYKSFSQFAINIVLTDEGLRNFKEVLSATFAYIDLIRSMEPDANIYEEIHNITKIDFKYLEKNEKYGENLAIMAGNMFDYDYKEVMYGDYIHVGFNATTIDQYLKTLTLENCIILIGSQIMPESDLFNSTAIKTEPWYSSKYVERSITREVISNNSTSVDYNFTIRPKNEYITNENNIVSCLEEVNKITYIRKSLFARKRYLIQFQH